MPRGRRRSNADALMSSAEFIGWALGALEREITETRQRLATLTEQARRLRSGRPARSGPVAAATFDEPDATPKPARRRRKGMSAEARKRISEQMKKRWADRRRQGKKSL